MSGSKSNGLVPSHGVRLTAAEAEKVLIAGDLSKLTPSERIRHYFAVCEGLGLDWRTRPFDYLKDRAGKMQLYARKDCVEQLRRRDGIKLSLSDPKFENDLAIVKATATNRDGRTDEDVGAVPIAGLRGEALANGLLKAITKAKRRVTLSICGLGISDDVEVDSIPGAERVHIDLPASDEQAAAITADPPQFEVTALDDIGEHILIDDKPLVFTTPVRFAQWLYTTAETSQSLIGLLEHNADAIDDAKQFPEAKEIIDSIKAPQQIYVNPKTGSDSNTGKAPSDAFQSVQSGVNSILDTDMDEATTLAKRFGEANDEASLKATTQSVVTRNWLERMRKERKDIADMLDSIYRGRLMTFRAPT